MSSLRHPISTLRLFLPTVAARGQSIFADKYLQSPNMNSLGEYGDVPVSLNGRDPRGDVRLTFSTAGHLTGSARRVVPHSGSGPLLPSAFYYDERGRLVQSVAANYPHLNPYLYCAANPVSLTDPSGMYVEEGSFSEFNQSKVDRMMEVLKYSKSFSTMFGMMCDNTSMTLRIEQGEGLVNEEGQKNPARFDPKKNTIYLDFNQMMFNSEGDLENIPWLGVFEEFYHGYQNMFSDIFNTNRNPEFEAKVFSMGAYWETYEDFRAPKDFGRLGNNYMIDNCTIFDNLTNGEYNLSFTTLNSNAFVNEYISSGHSFVQYWINEGKAGRRVPFAYDWPVTHVPQTLKALSFRTFLKTNLSNFLNR